MRERGKRWLGFTMALVVVAGFSAPAFSGELDPTAAPGPTMHTLEDIYNKISGIGAAPVEKTGQTQTYEVGDDGTLRKGEALPTPRFTDNSDGTVTDNLTGLIWDKDANRSSSQITWASALSVCNNLADNEDDLTDGSSAGDWRLPNIKELQSLIHFGFYSPALSNTSGTGKWTTDGDPFSNVWSSYYWSSTGNASNSSYAWNVSLGSGYVNYYDKSYGSYVWCVRGGP